MDYQHLLNTIVNEVKSLNLHGEKANYIPELGKVSPHKFGMSLITLENETYGVGDVYEKFSIQSIAKVFILSLAYLIRGEKLWKRVGVEPSGTAFNSLVQLKYENGIPRNPLINAGALVICDILYSSLRDLLSEVLDFIKLLSGIDNVNYSKVIVESERSYGHKNAALTHLMKSYGNIENPVEDVLNFYCHICSIGMSCHELTRTFLPFANGGRLLNDDTQLLSPSKTKRINAIMQTCGFYDEAGEFSIQVGLPGKSGVGGGIGAIHPGQYAVSVWSPRLNAKGNSSEGMKALEMLTTKTGLSIF